MKAVTRPMDLRFGGAGLRAVLAHHGRAGLAGIGRILRIRLTSASGTRPPCLVLAPFSRAGHTGGLRALSCSGHCCGGPRRHER